MQQATETGAALTAKIVPPVSVIGAEVVGFHVPEMIQVMTLIYIVLLVIHKTWHMWKEWKTGRAVPEFPEEMP